MREILPAATARLRLTEQAVADGMPSEVVLTTVLPLAWPALHRTGGDRFVSAQSGSASGDASRDLCAALAAVGQAGEGEPVTAVLDATEQTPRLQDVLDLSAPFEITVHDGFDYWVAQDEMTEEVQASLEQANESVVPTVPLPARPSAYWCRISQRTYLRWVLPYDEDDATNALARLVAAGEQRLGDGTGSDGRLLGAFRACGLLIPVWEVDPQADPLSYDEPLAALAARLEAAVAVTEPLSPEQRRARNGLLGRQVTLR